MLRLGAPSDAFLRRALEHARGAEFSYPEVGATRTAGLPDGYRADQYERSLGSADGRFERVVAALRHWEGHTGAGVRVFPGGSTVEVGGTVLFVVRTLGLWAVMPCRVVYVVESASWFSFAYGTLPGHVERGEVAMSVERGHGGEVVATIVSFSRTVSPLARAASPLARRVQTRFTTGYLEALERAS